jgi:hypothetical protein
LGARHISSELYLGGKNLDADTSFSVINIDTQSYFGVGPNSILSTATPQAETTVRIWISDKQVGTVHGAFPSGDLINELNKKCVGVVLTDNPDRADYRLEAGRAWCCTQNGELRGYKFTLFNKAGDAIYSSKTRELKNAAKDLCGAIGRTRPKQ